MSGPAAAASTSTSTGGTPCGPTPSRKRPSTADHTGPPPPPPHLTGPARSARLGSTPPPTPASTGGPDLRGTSPRSPYPGTGPGDARPGKRTCCPQAPGGRPTRRRREAPDRCAPHPAFRDSLISIQISTEDTRSIQQPPSSRSSRYSPRSRPEVTPAAVTRSPSSTTRASIGVVPVASSRSSPRRWVVAGRPSISPAIASTIEPPQTVATVSPGRSSASSSRAGKPVSRVRPRMTGMLSSVASFSSGRRPTAPGTTTRSACCGSSRAVACRDSVPSPLGTSRAPSAETSSTSSAPPVTIPPALSTSYGAMTSSGSNPSNNTICASMTGSVLLVLGRLDASRGRRTPEQAGLPWSNGFSPRPLTRSCAARHRLGPLGRNEWYPYRVAMHTVAVLALDKVIPFDLSTPIEVFTRPRLPGCADSTAPIPDQVLDALRQAAANGTRIASICSGAFILAATGLLDGHRATTHWLAAALLAELPPAIDVDPDVLYVDNGQLLTSAGAAAGLALCLHLIRRDHGSAVAADAARLSVMPLEREGGQAQFIVHDQPPTPRGSILEPVLRWMEDNCGKDLTLDDMATHAGMSTRTLNRRFREQTGTTPTQWLLRIRIRQAQHLLEATDRPVDRIASQVGFGSPTAFRDRFKRIVGTSPNAYRAAFHTPGAKT